ncbi:DUF2785 domain-containing protein [Bacillus sp. FJAT-45066]|uniref:DUF2785 domain-containing protein n=1 Tax=Bacillus sp. FJAT-45066 TaxID=2011010 RepID=UPI000BB87371|nr:DUF2785 domain-containing protein [Bacillus sp. FJAT-45066]
MEFKLQLIELKNKDLKCLSNEDLDFLLDKMVVNIGSVDPEFRDELIYTTFIRVINEDVLTVKQYQYLLEVCLDDNHLFYKIGEKNTDSVFTRSFSSLVIAGLLSKDRQLGLLSDKDYKKLFDRSVKYLENEQDTRGYVEEKGWAHSVAHGADLLVSLVRHPKFTEKNCKEVLKTLHNCLYKDATYIDDEEERLIFVIEALMEKKMDYKKIEQWILQILHDLEFIFNNEGFSNKYFRTKFNIANFLKTLYFRIGFINEKSSLRDLINDSLKELHQKIYSS